MLLAWLLSTALAQDCTTVHARDLLDVPAPAVLVLGERHGMRKVADVQEAKLRDGGPGREHRWTAEPGDCYRIFAVGEPSVEDLDVEVLSPRGRRIAFDTSDDRWPVVKPDGPFCVAEGGEYRARVHAQRGAGSYAIEIWRLR